MLKNFVYLDLSCSFVFQTRDEGESSGGFGGMNGGFAGGFGSGMGGGGSSAFGGGGAADDEESWD